MTAESLNNKIQAITYIIENGLISHDMIQDAYDDIDRLVKQLEQLAEPKDKAPEPQDQSPGKESTHPLINPDSRHYEMIDNVEAILRMEQMYSATDLMAWAKISAMKYRLRIGSKDGVLKEANKIAGFEAYYKYLEGRTPVENYS